MQTNTQLMSKGLESVFDNQSDIKDKFEKEKTIKKEAVKKKTQPFKKKKKVKKNITSGIAFVNSTFNNTIVTITNVNGDTVSWASAGSSGFKGARKSTPFAAQTAAEKAALEAATIGIKSVDILVKGQGSGRETAIRAIEGAGLEITSIQDITSVPHNGCRPPKRRRV